MSGGFCCAFVCFDGFEMPRRGIEMRCDSFDSYVLLRFGKFDSCGLGWVVTTVPLATFCEIDEGDVLLFKSCYGSYLEVEGLLLVRGGEDDIHSGLEACFQQLTNDSFFVGIVSFVLTGFIQVFLVTFGSHVGLAYVEDGVGICPDQLINKKVFML